MKSNYLKRPISTYLLPLFILVFASSCTIYQNVPDEDGIYSYEKKERRVIVANSNEHKEYESNYFTKELERIDNINGTDIFTDIEIYSSYNDSIPNATDSISDYNPNSAWGYNDNNEDVVININLNNNGFGWGNNWNLYDPYFSYSNFNPWFGRPWGLGWGNRYSPGFYWAGFRAFNNPFFNPFGPYHPFYHGLAGYRSARWRNLNGGFYGNGNFNYGRRTGYASTYNRRTTSASSRNSITTSRRNSSTTTRRRTPTFTNNRNSRTRNTSNTTRRRVTNSTSRNSNTRITSRRNTRSNSRSSTNRSSSRSTRSSATRSSSRSSSSRGSSSRGSSSRGSSSRGSSAKKGG